VKPELVTRFFNEARAATAISDPGIIQIFDFGHHSDGNAYIVMELLEGEPLDHRLRRLGTLPLGSALRILRQVASSLGAAHRRGIVHRDVKPENIFLVKDPEVAGGERTKLLDFGIAKLTSDHRVKTRTSAMMGTPIFMSPEQCRGAGHVDQRSDVYSLGCVLFTLLVGRPPFDAEGAGDIIAMHLREPPPPPSSVLPGLPPAVDQLVLRCLAKDREQRFASGAELAAALEALIEELGPLAAVPSVKAAPFKGMVADRKSTRLNSSHNPASRMPSSA
jgi:serine/threonine-protein kinase